MNTNRFRINAALFVIVALLAVGSARIATQAASATEKQPAFVSQFPSDGALVKALDNAMDPGEGQKKLQPLVGTFDVRMLTWVDPSKPPIESRAVAIHTWVLGHRYVQTMLSGFVMGEPFNAIGYAGFDNVQQKYVACYMDSGSTGMEWYTGSLAPDGKSATLTATLYDELTRKPRKVEMRVSFLPNGDHHTEFWEADATGKMFKAIEVQYRRQIS
jgi:hypothetical protein